MAHHRRRAKLVHVYHHPPSMGITAASAYLLVCFAELAPSTPPSFSDAVRPTDNIRLFLPCLSLPISSCPLPPLLTDVVGALAGRLPCDLRVSSCPLASLSIFKAFFGLGQNRESCVSSFDLVPTTHIHIAYTNGVFLSFVPHSHASARDQHREPRPGEKRGQPSSAGGWYRGAAPR